MLGKRRRSDAEHQSPQKAAPNNKHPPANGANGLPIPTMYMVTAWSSAEIPYTLPPLPELDPKLEAEVFTHPGVGKPNYERLEWLGDAYLEQIATCLISQTFHNLSSGRCSQIREQLVRNTTLAQYFRQYEMQSRARLPSDFKGRALGRGSSADKDLVKTQGDMFEAFVAGIVLSDGSGGLKTAVEWLKALWGKTILDQIEQAEKAEAKAQKKPQQDAREQEVASSRLPKEQLANLLQVPGIRLRYGDMPCKKKDPKIGAQLFSIGVYLDGWGETGKLLGVGTALGKKEAGHKAAAAALEDMNLLRVYQKKKEDYVAAKAAAKEAAEGEGDGEGDGE